MGRSRTPTPNQKPQVRSRGGEPSAGSKMRLAMALAGSARSGGRRCGHRRNLGGKGVFNIVGVVGDSFVGEVGRLISSSFVFFVAPVFIRFVSCAWRELPPHPAAIHPGQPRMSALPPTAGDAGYATQPSPLQKASHGTALLRAVQRSDTEALVGLLRAGLSPNPCNAHGDSVLQMVAKRSDYSLFRALVVDGGASLRVADSFGRTVLHHAAWADAASDDTFRIVRLVLERCGPEILWLTDKNGIGPFDFLRDEKWDPWAKFLEESQDVLTAIIGREPPTPAGGDVEGMLPDPPGALKPEMAARVASGEVVDAK